MLPKVLMDIDLCFFFQNITDYLTNFNSNAWNIYF